MVGTDYDRLYQELVDAMQQPVGEPCCELAYSVLHHHWGSGTRAAALVEGVRDEEQGGDDGDDQQ